MSTSRLKRKLNDLGVDPSSSKANENFCLIGTPLPPLEKSKDTGEFVPLWKQEVRDEKGRRRLHGAFTGGFSAGYFNSVGSKEGWTPSTFVSSRSDRAKQKTSKPEDFMDEEDLAEIRDGQKLVDTNEEMDLTQGTAGETQGRDDGQADSLVTALESALLPAPKDSVGARILKKMGWRLGHGIGPKVTWEQRKKQEFLSTSGGSEEALIPDDEEARKHLYPPKDTKAHIFPRKDNAHGLGYDPGLGLNDLATGGTKGGVVKGGPRISAGFGLGALNDADDDDLDVYDRDLPRGTGRRLAFDADVDDDRIPAAQRKQTVPTTGSSGSQSSAQYFHDGRPVLSGFVLSNKPVAEDRWFPLPAVPKEWTPNPRRVWEQSKENAGTLEHVNRPSMPSAGTQSNWKSTITADERGAMLGETPLPAVPRSVFDYLKPKDRERLQSMATGSLPDAAPPPSKPVVPRIPPDIAKAALQGFQPFRQDPNKQARYTAFLQSQADMQDELPIGPVPGQSVDEFSKELSDYAKSAQIFKPVNATMASRFTSAAVVELGPKAAEGLHTAVNRPDVEPQKADEVRQEENPKDQAVKLGMFGALTREVKPWQPAKLLCKRFGVKAPEATSSLDTEVQQSASDSGWQAEQAVAMGVKMIGSSDATGDPREGSARTLGRRDLANIGLGEDESQGQDTLTYERPGMDIFKAIFASDDEDSSDEKDLAMVDEDDSVSAKFPSEAQDDPHTSIKDLRSAHPVHIDSTDIDLSTFKPTFKSRPDRESAKSKSANDGRKKKEKKKKTGRPVLVSFADDEDGSVHDPKSGATDGKEKPHKKKRKKERRAEEEPEDDGVWVEKAAPAITQELSKLVSNPKGAVVDMDANLTADVKPSGPPRGRKRAVDFL